MRDQTRRGLLSRPAWYFVVAGRLSVALGLGLLALWGVYALPVPFWAKVMIDVLVINGVLVAGIAMGPISYSAYLQMQQRVSQYGAREHHTGHSNRGLVR